MITVASDIGLIFGGRRGDAAARSARRSRAGPDWRGSARRRPAAANGHGADAALSAVASARVGRRAGRGPRSSSASACSRTARPGRSAARRPSGSPTGSATTPSSRPTTCSRPAAIRIQPFFEGWTTLAGLVAGDGARRPRPARRGEHVPKPGRRREDDGDPRPHERRPGDPRAGRGLGRGRAARPRHRHRPRPRRSGSTGWTSRSALDPRACWPARKSPYALDDAYRFDGVRHAPLPLRQPVPVIIGASGERKGLRVVARHADLWQFWSPIDGAAEFAAARRRPAPALRRRRAGTRRRSGGSSARRS